MAQRILIVEDEVGLVLTLTDRLETLGYQVDSASDGEAGLAKALSGNFDLIMLDVMMPKKNGFQVAQGIREQNISVPILMLTARDEVVDKVSGLRSGADDYLTKPFDAMELVARVEALLRRSTMAKGRKTCDTLEFGRVKADFRHGKVQVAGVDVTLSNKELQLLRYLGERQGDVVSREELLEKVWGWNQQVNTRTVDVHMTWLRQKLEDNSKTPEFLITVRGVGYQLRADD